MEFNKRFRRKKPALFKSGQWHFLLDNAPVHNSIFVTDYLTKIGIKTVPQPPYSPDLTPCDFCLFPKLRGCRYETIEEMKEAVTKVIDTLTQEDLSDVVGMVQQVHCSRRRLRRRGLEFHVCTINKSAHTNKKPGNLSDAPRTLFSWAHILLKWTDSFSFCFGHFFGFAYSVTSYRRRKRTNRVQILNAVASIFLHAMCLGKDLDLSIISQPTMIEVLGQTDLSNLGKGTSLRGKKIYPFKTGRVLLERISDMAVYHSSVIRSSCL